MSLIHKCWLPYPQNHITGNAPHGTGNATHTGAVIFKVDITGTSAAKAGSPYPQTYFTGIAPKCDVSTGTVIFRIAIPVLTSDVTMTVLVL